MKRFFKFALVALATAAVAVACQKPEQQPEKIALKGISLNKPAVELAIGAKETLTVKFDPENVTEKPTIEWSSSAPAVATVAEGEVTAVAAGEATITAKAGSFTATCKVTVKGEEQPEPGDFTSPDWANIGAITNGNHTFKFTKDDKFAYFYTERPKDDRFGELWGDGVGYVYYAFDFDGDLTTGEELLGNGKYEYIAYIYCFGGSANAPEIKITAEGGVAPSSYSIANVIARGSVDANGLKLEYAVPLSDLPQLPEKFTIYTWGNKSLSKVEYKYPYEAPAPVDNWDYTPSAEYLAEDNLWKAVDANHTIESFYNPNWTGEKTAPELAFKESTYKVTLPDACPVDWNAQYWIRPAEQLVLDPAKKYSLKFTVNASTDGQFYVKLYQKGVDGAWSVETNPRVSLTANESYEIKLDDFSPITTPQDLLIDFSHHEANTTFYIKDIILVEVGGETPAELGPFDSNVEWAASTDDKAYTDNVLNVTYDGSTYENVANVKIGTSSKVGKFTLTIPAGTTYVTYWAIGWNGKDGVYKITAGENVIDGKAIANTGAANTSPYSVTVTDADKYMINLGGALPADLPVTIETTSDGYRAFFFGIQAHSDAAPNPPAPTGIKIDGDFSDWAGIEALSGNRPDGSSNSRIAEWKVSSDADNIYAYFKITKSKITNSRYFYVCFDFDKNESTGSTHDGIPGLEAYAVVYPAVAGSDPVAFVNGIDPQSTVYDNAGNFAEGVVTVYGVQDPASEDYVLFEMSIPRDKVGLAAGSALTVASSYNNYTTGKREVTL